MAEKKKVTRMLLKVDLQCSKCYKKVKKILCQFPQIQDQVYDEKNNTVTIKVVCCSPEKIRDKICCKGRGTIISIEILIPKPPDPPKPTPPKPDPPGGPGKPTKPEHKPPVSGFCCTECSEGRGGGPCYNPCYGQPAVIYFDRYCGRQVYGSCGCGGYRGNYYGSRCCEYYFIEDNSQGCTIM
ncbi:hypothetical protein Dsin_008438 [Dipteronia sinensis]|uniref:HMA domain-containing protein n=1 Tax=Dipteronia sinensis TaxID=43782 RepID=A0AAE0ANP7_9ROSI|nr:hypothetical protein Dsin_008438 [Dipteronia sinensis]